MFKSKIRWILSAIVVILALFGISWVAHIGPRLRLGYQANSILAGATRVETFRVMSPMELEELQQDSKEKAPTFTASAPQVDGCYVMATAKPQGPALANKISRILLDEQTYTSEQKSCITLPGIVFRIWKGSQFLDVVLCFHCGEMYTVTRDGTGEETRGVYTSMAGHSFPEFARLAKEAFPNDADIQAL